MFTLIYTFSALLALLLAWHFDSVYMSIMFLWLGLSLSAVSCAYLFKAPQIFRKSSNGAIPKYIKWVFIPFLFGAQFYNSWARRNDKVPPIQQINDNLFLACRLFPSDMAELKAYDVSAILDVTAEFDGLDWSTSNQELQYLNIPVLDHQSPTEAQLLHGTNWIQTQIDADRKVVIHCALGRGRSVLVMIAYLLSKKEYPTIQSALQKIQGIRHTAGLNNSQLKKLAKIAERQSTDKTPEKAALIVNPVSGGGKWHQNKSEIVRRLTVRYVLTIYQTDQNHTAKSLTQKAINKGHSLIIACGGDGTINEVAGQLSADEQTLGLIPLGTTNALSHVLYGARSKVFPVETSCDALIDQYTRKIDTARCNGELVLLMACIGVGYKMISLASRDEKNKKGQLAYISGFWQALAEQDTQTYQIKLDEDEVTVEASNIAIANAAPFSTLLAQGNGEPNLDDGLLDVTVLAAKTDGFGTMANMAKLALSSLLKSEGTPELFYKQAKAVRIKASQPVQYVIDGEQRQAPQLTISVEPKSLKVVATF
jgi:diacylglycerol kinase family enzyme